MNTGSRQRVSPRAKAIRFEDLIPTDQVQGGASEAKQLFGVLRNQDGEREAVSKSTDGSDSTSRTNGLKEQNNEN